jgi:hypothetical protein
VNYDQSEWGDVSTVSDGMSMEDLRRAIAERLACHDGAVANEIPPSMDVTMKLDAVR